ncbi:hypothetical protein DB43_FS00120 [Parachlamydia acanthamoebae]|uniref:Uncharacterized protein n=1 Tax=Parachlamydia acanthamoebae TaxID=83552 RepID=A0A0C1C2E4_9BACT|nr:hypothetical protein DB43_FS00120 [Parachlamydia acanthamoebae]
MANILDKVPKIVQKVKNNESNRLNICSHQAPHTTNQSCGSRAATLAMVYKLSTETQILRCSL